MKNLVQNVDRAFNYRPFEEERPMFRFKAIGGGVAQSIQNKSIKAKPLGRSSAMSMTHTMNNSVMSE